MENELIEIIEGYFKHSIFKADNFMVSRFETEDGTITVTGPSFDYDKNSKYILKGNFNDHYKYGFQFNYSIIEKSIPKQEEEIINFLSSSLFKGIGKKTAKKLFNIFGDDAINIIKNDLNVLDDLDLSLKQLLALKEGFSSLDDPMNDILFFLLSNGFNNIDAQKIIAKFKLSTKEIADINPFKYYNDVYGISFEKVKNFAQNRDFEDKENKFKEAYIIYLLTELTFNSGDTYLELNEFINILLKNHIDNYDEILERALSNKYIEIEDEKIYLYNDYLNEIIIANSLNEFENEYILDDNSISLYIEQLENKYFINFDDKQIQAISNFFKHSVSLIVGGPGTGKTTIIKAMVEMFNHYYLYNNIIVVAPTGRAAKRISEICEVESKTIHSLLKWNKESNTFIYGIDNPLLYDAIIIDEFSMVDADLFASLLKASKRVKKICLIGDDNQLPSIRSGAVLSDLLNSKAFMTTRLNINFRQSEGSEIINLANDIINQDVNIDKYKNDVIYIDKLKDNEELIKLINDDINNGYNLDDIQVLTPMYKGNYGIDNLNNILQEAYNPRSIDKVEKEMGKIIFRLDDKVIQLKNRPVADVYNGDVGRIIDIDLKEKAIIVDYQGTIVFYNYDELNELSLAYALSVHKAQGSEYQITYFILSSNNIRMLNKNLIYTAITRAKKKIVIIGDKEILYEGIKKNQKIRNTTLIKRILNVIKI